jgi:hypothetical protein
VLLMVSTKCEILVYIETMKPEEVLSASWMDCIIGKLILAEYVIYQHHLSVLVE